MYGMQIQQLTQVRRGLTFVLMESIVSSRDDIEMLFMILLSYPSNSQISDSGSAFLYTRRKLFQGRGRENVHWHEKLPEEISERI